ncbi:hypothetical protein [Roseobacter sp.]|uniref:hypothetical protein n=1 Tax=Roseobacter sp. TaxID=1907202 RepID=UPI003299FD1A
MTQHKNDTDQQRVDRLLRAAASAPPAVPDHLMARVLADAQSVQMPPRAVPRVSFRARLADLFGGWQGMGGLATAACAGLWIGWSAPAGLPDAGGLLLGYESTDLTSTTAELTSFGWDFEEG